MVGINLVYRIKVQSAVSIIPFMVIYLYLTSAQSVAKRKKNMLYRSRNEHNKPRLKGNRFLFDSKSNRL